jgi:NDP-sugar pyrophosphorylase family protein
MGPLKLIKDLPDNFLVMNGDILTDLNYSKFYDNHSENEELFTISSYTREQKIDYGVLETNQSNSLIGFLEKPSKRFEVSMGVYLASKKILNYIPINIPYGFDDLMLELIKNNKSVRVENFNGYWLDIGRPDDYLKAIEEFAEMKKKFIYE